MEEHNTKSSIIYYQEGIDESYPFVACFFNWTDVWAKLETCYHRDDILEKIYPQIPKRGNNAFITIMGESAPDPEGVVNFYTRLTSLISKEWIDDEEYVVIILAFRFLNSASYRQVKNLLLSTCYDFKSRCIVLWLADDEDDRENGILIKDMVPSDKFFIQEIKLLEKKRLYGSKTKTNAMDTISVYRIVPQPGDVLFGVSEIDIETSKKIIGIRNNSEPFIGCSPKIEDLKNLLSVRHQEESIDSVIKKFPQDTSKDRKYVVILGRSSLDTEELKGFYTKLPEVIITEWLKEREELILVFSLEYFNSGTSKAILDLLMTLCRQLKDLCKIVWLAGNEEELGTGYDYKDFVEENVFLIEQVILN